MKGAAMKIEVEKCFCINFLPISCYDKLVNTIHHNEWHDDEFAAGGFTVSNAKTIHEPAINEAFPKRVLMSGWINSRNKIIVKKTSGPKEINLF